MCEECVNKELALLNMLEHRISEGVTLTDLKVEIIGLKCLLGFQHYAELLQSPIMVEQPLNPAQST